MKRIILFVISIMVILSACNSNTANISADDVLVAGYSDSIGIGNISIEYEFIDNEKYANYDPLSQIELYVGNVSMSGSYYGNTSFSGDYFPVFEYFDKTGNYIAVDDNELLRSYRLTDKPPIGKILSQDECMNIACLFLKDLVDVAEYESELTIDQENQCYEIRFVKYIDGLATVDTASIRVRFDGVILSYRSFMLGRVPHNTKTDDIDISTVQDAIYNKLDMMVSNVSKEYDEIQYTEPIMRLTILKDGRRGLDCYVDVLCYVNKHTAQISSRLNLIIPLP
jgi:hypothetical protein